MRVAALLLGLAGCSLDFAALRGDAGRDAGTDAGTDAGPPRDSGCDGEDGAAMDAAIDAGMDAGSDAGEDGGPGDAGADSGSPDGGLPDSGDGGSICGVDDGGVDCTDVACDIQLCAPTVPAGSRCCSGACTDLSTDLHCGGCGLQCGVGFGCSAVNSFPRCSCTVDRDCPMGRETRQTCDGVWCTCDEPEDCAPGQICERAIRRCRY